MLKFSKDYCKSITSIKIATHEWITFGDFSDAAIFKGNIREELIINIKHTEEECFKPSFTVGTTELTMLLGKNTCTSSDCSSSIEAMYSIIIPDHTYCSHINATAINEPFVISSKDQNSLDSYKIVFFTQKNIQTEIDISDLLYYTPPISKEKVLFSIQQKPKEIMIQSHFSEMEFNKNYSMEKDFTFLGTEYGEHEIEYSIQYNGSEAKNCKLIIFVCHQNCLKCEKSKPTDNNHYCIECQPGYINDESHPQNCCNNYHNNKCYHQCIPIQSNTLNFSFSQCSDHYNIINNLEYLKTYVSKFNGIEFNATIFISPLNDTNNYLSDFKDCIGNIRNYWILLPDEQITIMVFSKQDNPINTTEYHVSHDQKYIDLKNEGICDYLLPYHSHDIKTVLNNQTQYFDFIQKKLKPHLLHLNDRTFHKYKSRDDVTNKITINMTYIDISECDSELRRKYNIDIDDDIYIYVTDYVLNSDQKDKKSTFYIYSSKGKELDISQCSNGITVDMKNSPYLQDKIKEAEEFSANKINVYDPEDPFFNDICVLFPLDNVTDIPRKDRINKYLQTNQTYCPDSCELIEIKKDHSKSNCKCPRPSKKNDELSFDGIKDNLLATLREANFEVIFCYKLVFDSSTFKHNYGCWVIIVIGVAISVNIVVMIATFTKPLEEILNHHHRLSQINDIHTIYQSPQTSHDKSKSKSKNNNRLYGSTVILPMESQKQAKTVNQPNKELKIVDVDFNELEYEDMLNKDKRNFCSIYWNYVMFFHPILNTFFLKSIKTLKTIKISRFFLGITLDLSLNAFFYSDKYISNNYNSDNDNNFFYNLPVSLFSWLLSSVINLLLNALSNSENGISKIFKIKIPQKIIDEIHSFLRKYCFRVIAYIIIQYMILLFLVYYVAAFCAVYQNSQIELLKSSGISLGISMSIPFGICIIFSIIRIISIKCKCKCLFCFLSFLMWFF